MLKEEELYRISLSHEPEEEIKLTAKKDLVLTAVKMLTHPDLFASFFEALSPPKQALLKEAVFDWGQNAVDLFPRLGLELPESKYSLYDFGKYPLDFLLDIGYDGGIRISWQLQTILHTALPLPKENWHIQKEIPGGGGTISFPPRRAPISMRT